MSELQTLVIGGTTYETHLTRKFQRRKSFVPADPHSVLCVIPGIVQQIHAGRGEKIERGKPLLVIEAMKMQNDVCAPRDGRIRRVAVKVGEMVTKGQLLIELEA